MVNTVGFKIKCNNGGFPIGENKIAQFKPAFLALFLQMLPKNKMSTKRLHFFFIAIIGIYFTACSRKTILTKPTHTASLDSNKSMPTNAPAKPVYKPSIKTATPKVIVVNDKVATKTVNGRYYYDLEGKRYWRNKRDGKYYLYYKGMFDHVDFK